MTDRELKIQMRQALDASMPPLPDDPELVAKVLERRAEKQRVRRGRMIGLRVAVAMAVMVLVMCSGLMMQGWSHIRLDRWQSDDGEHYYLQGELVTPPVNGTAEAFTDWERVFVQTLDWNEVVEALGKAPMAPSWLPEGWRLYQYRVDIIETISTFNVMYQKAMPVNDDPDNVAYLVFTSQTFLNPNGPDIVLEQNAAGKHVQLSNGMLIYVTTNFEYTIALWADGQTSYTMSAPIPEDDFLHIIRSMYGLD